MNISITSLEKKHFPVMLDEVIQICKDPKRNQLIIDCTFGGGGYSKALLKFSNVKIIALDRDKSTITRADLLKKKSSNRFKFYNERFSNLDKIISNEKQPDVIIFDLGLSTFQLQDYKRGFSFKATEKIDMQMGLSDISAEKAINTLDEKNLKLILKILGEEQEANKIVKNIIKARHIKQGGKIITISFHSIEDKIIKYYFTNYSSNKSNPSRYMPSQSNIENLFFEKYKNIFLTPDEKEIFKNPASRSAKLRYAIRTKQPFNYPKEFEEKFKKYLDIENV